mgnify:FL=1
MPNKKIIERHELIGLNLEITDAKNKKLIGIKGKILDETKNMFIIKTKNSTKRIIKEQVKMKITNNNENQIIIGKNIIGRSVDRIKK